MDTACAPRTSATFYCDAQLLLCFSMTTQAAMFDTAQAACQATGMALVKYDSAAKQLNVEKFFRWGCQLPAERRPLAVNGVCGHKVWPTQPCG
jgi:hypothetical protein